MMMALLGTSPADLRVVALERFVSNRLAPVALIWARSVLEKTSGPRLSSSVEEAFR